MASVAGIGKVDSRKKEHVMFETVSQIDAWLMALGLALAMICAWVAGWWGGRRTSSATEPTEFKLDDATLALLGLLIAFTFAMSIGKNDQRKAMLVADSNAIGDFYTCAGFAEEPERTKLKALIREYVEFRLDAVRQVQAGIGKSTFEDEIRRVQQMIGRMTDLVGEALRKGTPIAVPLINTLNEVSSTNAARIAAVRNRLPSSIVLLLFIAATVTALLIGRQQGALQVRRISGTLSFILLVALVYYVTLDLNQPQKGLITVNQQPLTELLESMGK